MSQKIRAKFNVSSITEFGNDGGRKVTLLPVIGNSEENKEWSKYTPSGSIELHITNPDAKFEFGEYYVDFVKAE